jgi:L-seryl-tRNA(Ser) seleniumtransferase
MAESDRSTGAFRPPSIEEIVSDPAYREWLTSLSRPLVTALIKEAVSAERAAGTPTLESMKKRIRRRLERWQRQSMQGVINATGVLVHTNLGRSPLDGSFFGELTRRAAGYGTLEFDLDAGERGKRGMLVHRLAAELSGAEAGLVVNNCAAAVLLVLASVRGREVIVSRGELVQIGGGFRIPDILAQSGVRMVEVGTTNRTTLRDYSQAVSDHTAAILKVHRSNFRMTGFVEFATMTQLRTLCDQRQLLLCEDLGSGAVRDLSVYGLPRERTLGEAVRDGADLICVSGDKLLGGPQAGLIVGRRTRVEKLQRHPLYRALRPGKTTLAALEVTLLAHLSGRATEDLPLYRLLAQTPESLTRRAERIQAAVRGGKIEIRASEALTGGGTLPEAPIPSTALVFETASPDDVTAALRARTPPVIARIQDDGLWFDLKTVFPNQDDSLTAALAGVITV